MASITITIPDAVLPRVIAALCSITGATPNAANAKAILIKLVMDRVTAYEQASAVNTAIANTGTTVANEITIT